MIISDLYQVNAKQFIKELETKRKKLVGVLSSVKPDGDYAETIMANVNIIQAALDAANDEYKKYDQPERVPVPQGDKHNDALTWIMSNCTGIRRDNGDLDYSLGQMIRAFDAGRTHNTDLTQQD